MLGSLSKYNPYFCGKFKFNAVRARTKANENYKRITKKNPRNPCFLLGKNILNFRQKIKYKASILLKITVCKENKVHQKIF